MYGCESWTIEKAEGWRIDAFKLWCGRRLLKVWTARKSSQSILKKISPEYSLEELMLKLKLQYFGHLMRRADSLEKTLMLGKIEGKRRSGWQRIRWLGWHHRLDGDEFEQALGVGESRESGTGNPGVLQFMGSQKVGHDWTKLRIANRCWVYRVVMSEQLIILVVLCTWSSDARVVNNIYREMMF